MNSSIDSGHRYHSSLCCRSFIVICTEGRPAATKHHDPSAFTAWGMEHTSRSSIHSFTHSLRHLATDTFAPSSACFPVFYLSSSHILEPFILLLYCCLYSSDLKSYIDWLNQLYLCLFLVFFPFMLACFQLTFLSHSVYILSIFLLHAFYVNVLFSPSHVCVLTFFVTFLPWVWERRISGNQWYTSTLDCSSLWHCNNVILFMLFIAEPLKKNITPPPLLAPLLDCRVLFVCLHGPYLL